MLEYLERKIEEEESEMIVKKETQKKYKRDIVAMPNKNPNLLFFFPFSLFFPSHFCLSIGQNSDPRYTGRARRPPHTDSTRASTEY